MIMFLGDGLTGMEHRTSTCSLISVEMLGGSGIYSLPKTGTPDQLQATKNYMVPGFSGKTQN